MKHSTGRIYIEVEARGGRKVRQMEIHVEAQLSEKKTQEKVEVKVGDTQYKQT